MKKTLLISLLICLSTFVKAQDIPDLFLENLTVDKDSVARGEFFTVSFDVSSDIAFPANQSLNIVFYASDDQILSTGDQQIGIANKVIGSQVDTDPMPLDVETGSKYIIAMVNWTYTVRESNYSNNVVSSNIPITITDEVLNDIFIDSFQINSFETDNVVTAGTSIGTDVVLNATEYVPGSLEMKWFLSSDDILDTDDYELGGQTEVNWNPSETFYGGWIIPEATDPGTWYIIYYVDSEGVVRESDESNNVASLEIIVNPKLQVDYRILTATMLDQYVVGQSPSVNFTMSEEEGNSNSQTKVGFYLSTDSSFSTDDRQLFTPYLVSPNVSSQKIFTIPDVAPGFYQLLIVADAELDVKESDETNNVFPFRFEIIAKPLPDITFKDILIPSTLSSGRTYSEQYSIENLNPVVGGTSHEVVFYISEDSTLDANDFLVTKEYRSTPNSTPLNYTANFTMNKGIQGGDYLLLGFVDFLNDVEEENEMNNDTILQVTIVNPDLTVSSLTSATTVTGAGQSFSADVNVSNISANGYAASSKIFFYLSEDDSASGDDLYLRTSTIQALEPGFSDDLLNVSFNVPKVIEAGDYFLLAHADGDSLLAEIDDGNNVASIPMEIVLPDLEVKSQIINPSTITAGYNVDLEFRVDNNALIPAPASNVKFYLSLNDTLELGADYYLGQQSIEALAAAPMGQSTNKIRAVNIPEIEAGDYKILFITDPDSLISESNEINNLKTGDIVLTNPDILPVNLDLEKDLIGIGEQAKISFNFTNQGLGQIQSTEYWMFLTGEKLEEDLFVTSSTTAGLNPSESSLIINYAFSVPSYIDSGTYYIKIVADYYDQALETDELNNADSIEIKITNPDLKPNNIIASPSVISVGFETRVELDVENISKVNAPATSLQYALSVDDVLDENDYLYPLQSIASIDSLAELAVTNTVIIPAFINPGDYFMIVTVDPNNLLPEADEDNNTITVAISVKVPDLEVINEDSDVAIIGSSENLMIEARVRNLAGDAKAPISDLGYYLSVNNALDSADVFLGSSNVASLEISETSAVSQLTFTVDPEVEAGNYHILFEADYNNLVNESEETNNVAALPIEITNPDLEPSNIVLSKSSLKLGEQFDVTLLLTNIGVSKSAAGSIKYFISTEAAINDSSQLLTTRSFTTLDAAADVLLENTSMQIPQFLDPVNYFIVAAVDYDSLIAESDESNNLVTNAITIQYPDLLTINQELDKPSVIIGDTVMVSYNLKNDGEVDSKTSSTGFYLKNDTDTLYFEQDSQSEAILVAFGTSSQVDVELIMPVQLDTGNYKLGIVADQFDNNVESDEDNNTFELDIYIGPGDFEVINAHLSKSLVEPDSINGLTQSVYFAMDVKTNLSIPLLQNELPIFALQNEAHLSTDDTFDTDDQRVGIVNSDIILSTDPKDSVFVLTGQIRFPSNIPKGDYYMIFQYDADSIFVESNEANNFFAFPFTYGNAIRPDIIVTDQQVIPGKFTRDKDVKLIHTFQNDGRADLRGTTINYLDHEFFISDDTDHDLTDVLVYADSTRDISIGTNYTISTSFNLSTDLVGGEKYLLGMNDRINEVVEQSEVNNDSASAITYYEPLPVDFVPTCTSNLPEIIRSGDSFKFSYEIENKGTGTRSGVLRTRLYFSSDQIYSEDDVFLETKTAEAISPNHLLNYLSTLTIPNGLSMGTYYVLIVTDYDQLFDESDEVNNVLVVPINVQEALLPDLIIDIADVNPATVAANDDFYVRTTITNLGGTNLDSVSIGLYVSSVNFLDEDAVFLGYGNVQGEPVGSGVSISAYETRSVWLANVRMARDIPPGEYVLFAKIDDDEAIIESSEQNNIALADVTVTDPIVPDFRLDEDGTEFIRFQGEVEGTFFSLNYNIYNDGNKDDFVDVSVYFSLDDVFDSQDILETTTSDISVAADGSTFQQISFELPDLLEGEYSVFLVADPEDEIYELDETNNISRNILYVLPPSKPDLTPEGGLSIGSNSVGINGLLEITQVVSNLDRVAVDSAEVKFYLSSDPTISAGDVVLDQVFTSFIQLYGQTTVFAYVVIPTNVIQGEYFVIAEVDPDNVIEESDESNNEESVAITITEPVQPDLVATLNSVNNDMVNANTQMVINYSIGNAGDGASVEYEVGFYLSKDDVFDAGDTELDIVSNPILLDGANASFQYSALVPADVDPGDYNLIVVADPENQIDEFDETNNEDLLAVTILEVELPDLIVNSSANLGFVNGGQSVNINFSVQNAALGVAGESVTSFYLSTDDIFDNGDTEIEMVETQSLQPGNLVNLIAEVTMPVVAIGDYFIILVSDSDNSVAETDETNNTLELPVEIGDPIFPDLIITIINTASASVNAGNFLDFSTTVRNQGQAKSDSTVVSFYLSADEVLDTNDLLLGTEDVAEIGSSSQRVVGSSYQIPTSVVIGDYFIIGNVNPNESLEEEDLNNNTNFESIEVLERLFPDLEVNFATVQPDSIPAGQEVNLSFSTFNIGQGFASASNGTVYLSVDSNLSTDDLTLATFVIDPIDVGESLISQVNFSINKTVNTGQYTLIIEVDSDANLEELNEDNNLFNTSLVVLEALQADLLPEQLSFDNSSINAGGTLGVSFELTNIGETASIVGDVGVYFSDDNTLDSSDELIAQLVTNPLNVGASDQFNVAVPIPLDRSPGDYFIIVNADNSGVEDELDETNNTISGAITITEPLPGNLVVASVIPSVSSIAINEDLTVDVTLSNSEPNAVLASTLAIYLSNDATLDGSDVIVETRAIGVLTGNASEVVNLTLSFNNTLATGDYFLIAKADNDEVVTETNELDNEGSVAITLTEVVLGLEDALTFDTYPNPATHFVNIKVSNLADQKEVRLFDLMGKIVLDQKHSGDSFKIDISHLLHGKYILIITDGKEVIKVGLIKE